MQCSNCYQETEPGKFCTNCGASISADDTAVFEEASAGSENHDLQTMEQQYHDDSVQTNEPSLKQLSANFGHFFLTLVKKPSDATKANGNDLLSGIISIVLYSLLFALGYYLIVNSFYSSVMGNLGTGMLGGPFPQSLPFTNGFLWPFLKFIILFAVIIFITFAGLQLTTSKHSFTSTVAKYGGYLIPFLLLLVAGYILLLISLYSIGIIAITVSVSGAVLIIPTLILLEKTELSVDRVYLLIIIYILNILAISFILRSIVTSLLHLLIPMSMMGSTGGMFGQ